MHIKWFDQTHKSWGNSCLNPIFEYFLVFPRRFIDDNITIHIQ